MIDGFKQFSGNFRSLSVFALIVSFLVLGSCPLKRAVQVMLDRSVETEHTGVKHKNSFTSVVCLDSESSFSNKMSLPERQAENSASVFTAVLFTAFWVVWLFKSDSQFFRFRDFRSVSLESVPLYLRNCTFII
jgi:hypothetical protein